MKGRSGSFDFVNSPDRITTPLVKNPETGEFEPADWDTALDLVARRFAELKEEHGGESIAAFACSRSTNEDIYLFQKMARCAFDSPNVDNLSLIHISRGRTRRGAKDRAGRNRGMRPKPRPRRSRTTRSKGIRAP